MDCYTLLNTFRGTVVSVTQGWLYLAYPVAYNVTMYASVMYSPFREDC